MTRKTWSGFSKRRNSTKQPTGGTSVTVTLKDGTSIESPVFTLSGNDFTIDYVEAFGHYYFVRDITSVRNGIIEVSCVQDRLATYKSAITGSNQYVKRSASAIGPLNIADPLNPPTNYIEVKSNLIMSFTDAFIDWDAQNNLIKDHFILAVVGKTGVEYWGLTWAELQTFFDNVFSQNFLQQFTSQFYDYRDCVISLKRVTYKPTGDIGQQIYLGEHGLVDGNNNPITATALNSDPMIQDSGLQLIAFPADDHLATRNYPYYAPYTMATLFLPLVGLVPVDVSLIAGDGKIGVKASIDKFTADIVYKVYTTDDKIIGTYYGNAGAEIPIATQNYNPVGMGAGAIQAIGGIAAAIGGGPVAGLGAGAVVGGLSSIFSGAKTHTQVNGTLSSFGGGYISQGVYCDVYTNCPASWSIENFKSTNGVIVNEQLSLSGLTGYVQCENASVPMIGFDDDRAAIEEALNSGIYIE